LPFITFAIPYVINHIHTPIASSNIETTFFGPPVVILLLSI